MFYQKNDREKNEKIKINRLTTLCWVEKNKNKQNYPKYNRFFIKKFVWIEDGKGQFQTPNPKPQNSRSIDIL